MRFRPFRDSQMIVEVDGVGMSTHGPLAPVLPVGGELTFVVAVDEQTRRRQRGFVRAMNDLFRAHSHRRLATLQAGVDLYVVAFDADRVTGREDVEAEMLAFSRDPEAVRAAIRLLSL